MAENPTVLRFLGRLFPNITRNAANNKTVNVILIQTMTSPQGFADHMRSDSSQDLAYGRDGTLPKHLSDSFHLRSNGGGAAISSPGDSSTPEKDGKDSSSATTPFGIGEPWNIC